MASSGGGKKKNHIFKLPGVKPDEIDRQYGFATATNSVSITDKNIPSHSTKISELQNYKQNVTIVDELKNSYHAKISLIQIGGGGPGKSISGNELGNDLPHCFWDRHPFATEPVYCPVNRVSKPKIKNYTSHVNGKQYKIQDSMQKVDSDQEFSVDGTFCSVECCLAFIEDQQHDPLYQYSEYYLRDIYPFSERKCAPHWRLLKPYGGNMSIEEFRKSFVNTVYSLEGVIYHPVCFLYKENYHL